MATHIREGESELEADAMEKAEGEGTEREVAVTEAHSREGSYGKVEAVRDLVEERGAYAERRVAMKWQREDEELGKMDEEDKRRLVMADFPKRMDQGEVWEYVRLDLMGPFQVRLEVNSRSQMKVWGMVLEDAGVGGVHLEMLRGCSAAEVMVALRRFGSIKGWPAIVQTDPGSKVESAQGTMTKWWVKAAKTLEGFAVEKSFRWDVSSLWRQGKIEKRVGVVRELLHMTIDGPILAPLDLQTVFCEVGDICNDRPISVGKPQEDGTYMVLTPNHLLKEVQLEDGRRQQGQGREVH